MSDSRRFHPEDLPSSHSGMGPIVSKSEEDRYCEPEVRGAWSLWHSLQVSLEPALTTGAEWGTRSQGLPLSYIPLYHLQPSLKGWGRIQIRCCHSEVSELLWPQCPLVRMHVSRQLIWPELAMMGLQETKVGRVREHPIFWSHICLFLPPNSGWPGRKTCFPPARSDCQKLAIVVTRQMVCAKHLQWPQDAVESTIGPTLSSGTENIGERAGE